jgi:hypothetical protein
MLPLDLSRSGNLALDGRRLRYLVVSVIVRKLPILAGVVGEALLGVTLELEVVTRLLRV